MGDGSKIEWTEATWNPVLGCTKVSPGCDHCYAITMSRRIEAMGNPDYAGLTVRGYDAAGRLEDPDWTNKITELPARLDQPLRWTKPRRIFVNSMSDLFHDGVTDQYIVQVFAVMAAAPAHTFQLLTKRHGRMKSLLSNPAFRPSVQMMLEHYASAESAAVNFTVARAARAALEAFTWPLPNLWLGVSVEDQTRANQRVMALLDTPAAIRWLSLEPLLGPVDLTRIERNAWTPPRSALVPVYDTDSGWKVLVPALDWIVVGGESGPGARPMNPAWVHSLLDQANAVGLPFLFKQWGAWGHAPGEPREGDVRFDSELVGPSYYLMRNVGKKAAGRLLGGRTYDEYPTTPKETNP